MIGCLFVLELEHAYFTDGRFDGCTLRPDQPTQALMTRHGLALRKNQGSWGLYTSHGDDLPAFVQYLCETIGQESIRFFLEYAAADFFSMTELPLDWAGQIQLSTQSVAPASASAGNAVVLQPLLVPRTAEHIAAIGEFVVYLADLKENGGHGVRYTAAFKARQSRWMYYLINRSRIKLTDPAIRNLNQEYFDGPENVVLPNGEAALCFTSGERLFPLQQVPTNVFDLFNRSEMSFQADAQPSEQCVIKGLPTPAPGQISVRREAGESFVFSAMHVYV